MYVSTSIGDPSVELLFGSRNTLPTGRAHPLYSLVVLSNEAATAAAVLVLALVFVGLAITDLVTVMDEEANNEPSWNKMVFSCRDRIVKAVPLTAMKSKSGFLADCHPGSTGARKIVWEMNLCVVGPALKRREPCSRHVCVVVA